MEIFGRSGASCLDLAREAGDDRTRCHLADTSRVDGQFLEVFRGDMGSLQSASEPGNIVQMLRYRLVETLLIVGRRLVDRCLTNSYNIVTLVFGLPEPQLLSEIR